VSIVYHHYALNDDFVKEYFVVDENVVVEINDLKLTGDDQQDDLNTMDVRVVVIVVENVLMKVVKVVVEDDEDEDDDEMDDQDDEVIQEVSIEMLLSSMNNVMLIEAKYKQKNISDDFPMRDQVCIHLNECHSFIHFQNFCLHMFI
jgi:hypothetical protein